MSIPSSPILPVGKHVVVKVLPPNDTTPGGIALPHGEHRIFEQATVLAIGPDAEMVFQTNASAYCSIDRGDTVLISYGRDVEVGGEKFRVVTPDEIVGVLA